MKKKTVCVHCGGDKGTATDLVYCANCDKHAIHLYCLDDMPSPGTKPESVHWICHHDCPETKPQRKRKLRRKTESNNRVTKFIYSFKEFPNIVNSPSHGTEDLPEPLIRSVWSGNFDVWFEKSVCQRIGEFDAFLSSRALCANEEAVRFLFPPTDLQFETVTKSTVWFGEAAEASADDLEMYFFPSCLPNQRLCDCLILEMVRGDFALRAVVGNGELVVFTSMDLPFKCRRFQGALYLWGVVRNLMI